MSSRPSEPLDSANKRFWAYVCGSQRKQQQGDQFDGWYWKRYPWLEKWIPFDLLKEKNVLEVGIGSGTTARRLSGICNLSVLDVAMEPLAALQAERPVQVHHGSILDAPFDDDRFDWVVAIGCLHHTGDVQRAMDECYRVLKEGGGISLMVYHKDSGKQELPHLWDASPDGSGPPFTEWFTPEDVDAMLARAGFDAIETGVENFRAPNGLNVYARARK